MDCQMISSVPCFVIDMFLSPISFFFYIMDERSPRWPRLSFDSNRKAVRLFQQEETAFVVCPNFDTSNFRPVDQPGQLVSVLVELNCFRSFFPRFIFFCFVQFFKSMGQYLAFKSIFLRSTLGSRLTTTVLRDLSFLPNNFLRDPTIWLIFCFKLYLFKFLELISPRIYNSPPKDFPWSANADRIAQTDTIIKS